MSILNSILHSCKDQESSVDLPLNVTVLQSSQVKCTLEDPINEFIIQELNLLVFAATMQHQIQIHCILARIMSSEFFTKAFLHQIQESLASRNFTTTLNVTSLLVMHAGMHLDESEIYNCNGFNFQNDSYF